jgi:hypothetical protein
MTHIITGPTLRNADNWKAAYAWATKHIGHDNFVGCGSYWTFYYEKDAVLFTLRWA